MGVLDRLLRVGEGKKLKALASLVPDVTALEPEIQALSDDALRAKTPSSGSGSPTAKISTTC
jgi:preprotein translocase subunit SecA